MDSRERANFRNTRQWKDFRKRKRAEDKTDYLTKSRLTPGFNLHHMDLNPDHYKDLSNTDNFICLNRKSHDLIHFLYTYYAKDPTILLRLENVLKMMKDLNS